MKLFHLLYFGDLHFCGSYFFFVFWHLVKQTFPHALCKFCSLNFICLSIMQTLMLLMYNGISISRAVEGPTVHTDLSLVSDEKANHILQMAYSHALKWGGLIVTALWCCWQLWLQSVLWNNCSFYEGCLMIGNRCCIWLCKRDLI